MKRTILILSIATAALLGPAAAAYAGTGTDHQSGYHGGTNLPACGCGHGHHGHHKPPSGPAGGGPGRHHHKHHPRPVHHPKPCPPPKHHHPKPPPVIVHPRPPVLTPPAITVVHKVPDARVRVVHASPTALPTQLAFTASPYDLGTYTVLAVAGIALGGVLLTLIWLTEPARKFNRQVTR